MTRRSLVVYDALGILLLALAIFVFYQGDRPRYLAESVFLVLAALALFAWGTAERHFKPTPVDDDDVSVEPTAYLAIYLPPAACTWEGDALLHAAGEVMEALGYELEPELHEVQIGREPRC